LTVAFADDRDAPTVVSGEYAVAFCLPVNQLDDVHPPHEQDSVIVGRNVDGKDQEEWYETILEFGEWMVEASRAAEDGKTVPAVVLVLSVFKRVVKRPSQPDNGSSGIRLDDSGCNGAFLNTVECSVAT